MWQSFLRNDYDFQAFGDQHLAVIIVFSLFAVGILWSVRNLNSAQNLLLSRCFTIFIFLTLVLWTVIKLYFDRFNLLVDLPLSLCNLIAVLGPLLFWHPHQRRLEVMYFLVTAGTFQAMLTPDLYVGFPSNEFFKYWIVHGGVILLVVHQIFAFQLYPRFKGVMLTFGWINLYSAVLYPLNIAIGANYFYLISKPGNASILDFFGPWPMYIFAAELVAMVFFAVAYLPFFLVVKSSKTAAA
mgnify:CR=1 FL=1|jgi:hypothetical integral membrane protein (TIGR02206 family)|tara:strand:+ start:9693 stop:10415 length:723 start_codon:yes stop_codon:yes gene_type:complete